jgi:excisionase family DNA binding protein
MSTDQPGVRAVALQGGSALEPSVTVADVAKALAVSTDAVRREIRRGALAAEKVFGRVRIRQSELERYRAERRIGKSTRPSAPASSPAPARRRSPRGTLAALRAIEDEVSG